MLFYSIFLALLAFAQHTYPMTLPFFFIFLYEPKSTCRACTRPAILLL
jgi:hypothetical protein